MKTEKKRRMLVLDSAYTYEVLTQGKLTRFVESKDVNGYFDHVWTVHAVASLFSPPSSGLRFGRPIVRELSEGHTHIEGKIGRFEKLSWFPFLNFLFAQLDLIWFLLKIIKKDRITIVRSEDYVFNGILGLIIVRLKRLPFVIGVWGNHEAIRQDTNKTVSPHWKWKWLENTVERFILRRADFVFCGTEYYQSFAINQGVDKENTAVSRFGNAIEASHFLAPAQREDGYLDLADLGITNENIVMLISRLELLKRPEHMVKAVACLQGKDLNIKMLFAGDGAAKDSIASLAEKLGVSNQIVFCGNRDQKWLLRVIPRVAVIVSPSTGRALTEAALGGAPIVAYDTDWQNEIIEHGITGELVPDLDYKAMGESIEKIIKNDDYARKIGKNVRERALKMMDPKNIDNKIIQVYEKLLDPKGAQE